MSTLKPIPTPGELYADVLWNTALLPPYIQNPAGEWKEKSSVARYDGISWDNSNPTNGPAMRININQRISSVVYSSPSGGYDCTNNVYGDGSALHPFVTAGNIPSRYVVMGGDNNLTVGTQRQQADLLEVTAANAATGWTFLQTDWRAPPDYNPGPLSTA
jgi:hypothetical protein